MSAAPLAIAAIALLLLAAGLWLWSWSRERERRQATASFVERQIAGQWQAAQASAPAGGAPVWRLGTQGWARLLRRAGVSPTPGFYCMVLGLPLLLALLAFLLLGPVAGVVTLPVLLVLSYFRLWWKAEKRYRRMVEQLPVFLDSLVRLITIGNSLGSAFQAAAPEVDEPLQEVLGRVASLTRSGKELDAALRQVSAQYGLHELYLVAAVVGVALRFGGRSDQVLERMAAFMRDLQQARQELVALSAEIRLSAWILALLPVGIAAFILVFNNDLFMNMWRDPVGSKMLLGALALQIAGSYWLYRMAKSI
ncbi:type II secretion system F family protein [Orrella sp. JC864]|uniref:type II secretion system F family protein n=1 Tax=Orrella sp. JC864 TaxID=3120298 RepID=UPI003009F57F